MKNDKGFTLVELLAVIVILAVVILIAVTAVVPRMNNAKKNALINEALVYLKSAKEDFAISNNNSEEELTSKCIEISELNEKYVKKNDSNYSGTVVSEYSDGVFTQTISLTNGKYYIYGTDSLNISNISDSKQTSYKEVCNTKLVYEDLDESSDLSMGDRISIGDERFYYITTDSEENLVFLAEYNLDNTSKQKSSGGHASYWVAFSNEQYWSGSSDYTPFGDSSYIYIYRTTDNQLSTEGDADNIPKTRVNAYKEYLNELGIVTIIDARLMSYEEAALTGCSQDNDSCPTWVSNHNYWLGSKTRYADIWFVSAGYYKLSRNGFSGKTGVRPVITVSPSSIQN